MRGKEFDVMKMMLAPASPKRHTSQSKEDWVPPPAKSKTWLGLRPVAATKVDSQLSVCQYYSTFRAVPKMVYRQLMFCDRYGRAQTKDGRLCQRRNMDSFQRTTVTCTTK